MCLLPRPKVVYIFLCYICHFLSLQLDRLYKPIGLNLHARPKALRPTKNDKQSIQLSKSKIHQLVFHNCDAQHVSFVGLSKLFIEYISGTACAFERLQALEIFDGKPQDYLYSYWIRFSCLFSISKFYCSVLQSILCAVQITWKRINTCTY